MYVWDFDKYSDNDLLGVTFVSLQDGKINSSQPTRPKWYKLSIGAIHFGSILISLNLYSMDVKIPRLNIIPDTTEV